MSPPFYFSLPPAYPASAQVYATPKRQSAALAPFPVTTVSQLETKSDSASFLKATACQIFITTTPPGELHCFVVLKDTMMCVVISQRSIVYLPHL